MKRLFIFLLLITSTASLICNDEIAGLQSSLGKLQKELQLLDTSLKAVTPTRLTPVTIEQTQQSFQELQIAADKYITSLRTLIDNLGDATVLTEDLPILRAKQAAFESKKDTFQSGLDSLKPTISTMENSSLVKDWLDNLEGFPTILRTSKARLGYLKPEYQRMKGQIVASDYLTEVVSPGQTLEQYIDNSFEKLDSYFDSTNESIKEISDSLNSRWQDIMQEMFANGNNN